MALYVRTAAGGTGPDVTLFDLGITVSTGVGWTLLSAADGYGPEAAAGQFTAIELKESGDLYAALTGTPTLEWSTDGVTARTDDYDMDVQLVIEAQNNHWDFTFGRVTLPNVFGPYSDPKPGDIYYDADDGYLAFYDGTQTMYVALTENGSVTDHGSLSGLPDDDHPQYTLLTGDENRNAVTGTFDFSDGYLIAPNYNAAPTTSVIGGALSVVNGVLYAYDETRTKWLSVDRKMIWAGRDAANASNIYLRTVDGIATSTTGYRALRNGTITGMVAQTDAASTWTLRIRRNNVVTNIASLAVTSTGTQDTATNVDFSQGDELELYCDGTGVSRPIGGIEIAWRV